MFFLNATDPATIKLAQDGDDRLWASARSGSRTRVAKKAGLAQRADARIRRRRPGRTPVKAQVIHFINKPMPGGCRSARRARCSTSRTATIVPIIRDPAKVTDDVGRGVLFPGLRLRAAVLAGRARDAGDALSRRRADACCRPATCAAAIRRRPPATHDKGQQIITDNRVLFHRVANTLNYLDIKTVIVSCGTCLDQLQKYEFEKIFPGCRLLDIHEYLLEKGVQLDGVTGVRYMYHDPCHTPMKTHKPLQVVSTLMGSRRAARTTAAAANRARSRRRGPISRRRCAFARKSEMRKRRAMRCARDGFDGEVKVLTSCPSCLQGLSRFDDDAGTEADYIVVEIARHLLGEHWMPDYVAKANRGGIERVLV